MANQIDPRTGQPRRGDGMRGPYGSSWGIILVLIIAVLLAWYFWGSTRAPVDQTDTGTSNTTTSEPATTPSPSGTTTSPSTTAPSPPATTPMQPAQPTPTPAPSPSPNPNPGTNTNTNP
jgi:hypothetical protein